MYGIIKKILFSLIVLSMFQSSFSQIVWYGNAPYIQYHDSMCKLANVNFSYDNSFIEYDSSNYILIKEVCSSYFYFQGMRHDTTIINSVYAKPLFDGTSHQFQVIDIDSVYEKDIFICYLIHIVDAKVLPDSVKKLTPYTVVSMCEDMVDNTLPLITIGDILNLILVPLENEMECFCRQAYDSWKGLYLHNKYLYLGNSVKKFCLVSTENIKELYYLPPE